MGLILFFIIFAIAVVSLSFLGNNKIGNGDIYDTISLEAVLIDEKSFAEPRNETEFRKIFEDLAGKLYGYRISLSQSKCPDLLLYDKQAKKTIRAELEYAASDFFKHKHQWDKVDMIVCWHNDIEKSDIPILEYKDKITEYYKNTAGAE